MSILTTLIPFAVVLGTTVVVHEFGHFAAAKLLKMQVEVFSVGFGKRLFGFKFRETDYRLSLLPLGGYVKIMGMEPDDEAATHPDAYLARPKWHQFIVLVAGPAMNVVLALLIPMFIGMFLFKSPAYLTKPAVVGAVPLGSSAEQAGLQPGDAIVKFAGIENPAWSKVRDYTLINDNKPIPVTVMRNGAPIDLTLVPQARSRQSESYGEAGLLPPDIPTAAPTVASVEPGLAAAQGGLQANDRLVKMNGQDIPHFDWFRESLQAFGDKEITLTVERGGALVDLKMTPKTADGVVRLGLRPSPPPPIPMTSERKSLGESLTYAVDENVRFITLTVEAFKQIFNGQRNLRETLSGPIGIARASGEAYQGGGIEGVLVITSLLSLNLGVFNLLPIPALDGGHIMLIFLETLIGFFGLRMTTEIKYRFTQAGFVVLMGLMVFVFYNDISRLWFRSGTSAASDPVKNPPPPPPVAK
jgi:regulator of sigma E protease